MITLVQRGLINDLPEIKTLKQVFNYDPLSGLFTRDGKPTGCLDRSTGYVVLRYKCQKYYAHRIAFVCMGLEVPDQVDHKDGVRSNNKWINLRESNNSKNSKNSSMKSSNTSGSTGVYWSKRDQRWIGEVTIDGKKVYVGRSNYIEEITNKIMKYRAEKGFSSRHGKRYKHS